MSRGRGRLDVARKLRPIISELPKTKVEKKGREVGVVLWG
jgi:hypothetical protein